MIQQRLISELERLSLRRRLLRMLQLLAVVWFLAAVVCAGLWLRDVHFQATAFTTAFTIGGIALMLAAAVCVMAWASDRNHAALARLVEAAFPELKSSLITAIEQRPESAGGEFGYLQASVIRQAVEHARRNHWEQVVSRRKLAIGMAANCLLFALFAVALFAAARNVVAGPEGDPLAGLLPSGDSFSMTIEPGNVEIERGTSLLVLTRVQGRMPSVGTLEYRSSGADPTLVNMPASLKDPLLSARIPVVDQPLEYSVKLDQYASPTYQVTVFDYPSLDRADVKLTYPSFTGLKEKLIEDVRTVSAVEGTQIVLLCRLNKPVKTAVLSNSKGSATGEPIELLPTADDPRVYSATWTLRQSRRLKLELVDEAGRKNKKDEQFTINVLPNQPANIKPIFPARDLEVSALEELDIKASVNDDFGIHRVGIAYSFAGQPVQTLQLAENLPGKEKHELAHKFALEELGADVDQLLSYYWWVEDFDNQGQPRRAESDMYFAEVRPFEEIYRQGEQPPGGEQQRQRQNQQPGGQNAQDAQNLAKLQKDIINATWKVVRRELTDQLSKTFAEDVEQIRASQAEAAQQATALGQRLQDEKSQEHLADVLKQMQQAVEQLKLAVETSSRDPLPIALTAEQSAYQSLLKLRAREHEVVRQQQQSGQQGAQQDSARSQQQREQLDQLDLREDENRYETQRSAEERQQESAEERENRQVLNRLRELARRQHDLNDRLKELQTALEAAKTPQEQEEVRRQLKRLQEEERQILQDTDELQSRLDQPETQERAAEERQQLEQTRDQVRKASESLEQEKVGQAAAAGAKAEQQFDELREEFRRRASNRFGAEMQQMRDSARQLDENQRAISEQLRGGKETPEQQPSLTDTPRLHDDLTKHLADQRERLSQLQDQMRDTIERAEATEPLLSERLYETARKAREQNLDQLLQATDRLAHQNMPGEAQRASASASDGARQLREGIEKAADGILGDETEALRRARQELQELTRELDQEVRQNGGAQPGSEQQPASDANDASQRPGENGPRQPGENRAGQPNPAGEQDQPNPSGQRQSGAQRQQATGRQSGSQPSPDGQAKQPGGQEPEQQQSDERQPGQAQENKSPNGEQPGEGQGSRPGSGQRGEQQQKPQQQQSSDQPGPGAAGEQPQSPETPSDASQDQAGDAQQPGNSPGENQNQAQKPGQRGNAGGKRPAQNRSAGQQPQNGGGQQPRQGGPQTARNNANVGGVGPFEDYEPGPLSGQQFRQWSDRLRDVEEMVGDPQLRADAARIRERARAMRNELQRHSAAPEWNLVRDQLLTPLTELEKRVSEEVLRRTSKKALVPLDRDPVPPEYSEKTSRYYQQLGAANDPGGNRARSAAMVGGVDRCSRLGGSLARVELRARQLAPVGANGLRHAESTRHCAAGRLPARTAVCRRASHSRQQSISGGGR